MLERFLSGWNPEERNKLNKNWTIIEHLITNLSTKDVNLQKQIVENDRASKSRDNNLQRQVTQAQQIADSAMTLAEGASGIAQNAQSTSAQAKLTAAEAKQLAQVIQSMLNQMTISGDSSVEAAASRVGLYGVTFATLKQRLDTEIGRIEDAQETGVVAVGDLAIRIRAMEFERERFNKQTLLQGRATITNTAHNGYFKIAEAFVAVAIGGFGQHSTNYDVQVSLVSGDSGLVGDLIVYDKTLNGFKVRMTGSASSASFVWTLINKGAA